MFEILALLVLLAWVVFSIWIAARVTRLVGHGALKVLIFVFLAPLLAALPLADEIIGKFQFDKLCDEAGDVKVYATLPVGEELYLPDGTWRLTDPLLRFEERKKVSETYESLIRWESNQVARTTEFIPISESATKIFDRTNGVLLASFRSYGTPGGRISRMFEKPTLVRDQCLPPSFYTINQRILPYRRASGASN